MKKFLLVVALLVAVAVPSRAQTVGAAGGPINAQNIIPFPPATPACTVVSPSTFSPTQLVGAATTTRLGLYIINQSSMSLSKASSSANADTRAADVWVLFSGSNAALGNTAAGCAAAPTAGTGPSIACLSNIPGIRLRGLLGTSTTESATDSGNRLEWNGFGTPQGAIYAIAESTGSTVDVKAKISVCDFQSQ